MTNGFEDGRQRPAPLGDDSKSFQIQHKSRARSILGDLMNMLPSIYRSSIPSSEYASHLETFAEEMARISLALEELQQDISFEGVRSEFLQQTVGYLVFIDDLSQLDVSDARFRELLLSLIDLFFEGTTPDSIRKAVELITSKDVRIEEKFQQTDDPSQAHTFDVYIDSDGEFSDNFGQFQRSIGVLLDLVRPAHTIFGLSWVFEDIVPSDEIDDAVTWNMNRYRYDDVRRNWEGLSGYRSTSGEIQPDELDRLYETNADQPAQSVHKGAELIIPQGPNSGRYRVKEVHPSGQTSLQVHPRFRQPESSITYRVEIDRRGEKSPRHVQNDVSDQFRRLDRLKLSYTGPEVVNWTESFELSVDHNYHTEVDFTWDTDEDNQQDSTESNPTITYFPRTFDIRHPIRQGDEIAMVYDHPQRQLWSWDDRTYVVSGPSDTSFTLPYDPNLGTERVYHNGRLLEPSAYSVTNRTIDVGGPSLRQDDRIDIYYHRSNSSYQREITNISSNSTDEISLSQDPQEGLVEVFLNGLRLVQGSSEDFEVQDRTVQFHTNLHAGDVLQAWYRTSGDVLDRDIYVADSDYDTPDTDHSYVPGSHFVYVNGSLLRYDRVRPYSVQTGDEISVVHDPIGTHTWEWQRHSTQVTNPVNPSVLIDEEPYHPSVLVFINGILADQSSYTIQQRRISIDPATVGQQGSIAVLYTSDSPAYRIESFQGSPPYHLSETPNESRAYLFLNGQLRKQGVDFELDGSTISALPPLNAQGGDRVRILYWSDGKPLERTDHTAANGADTKPPLPGYVSRDERLTFVNGQMWCIDDQAEYEVPSKTQTIQIEGTSWDGKKARVAANVVVR
jgi:hypothetical protein